MNMSARGFALALAVALSGCSSGAVLSASNATAPSADAWPDKFAFKVAVSLSASAEQKLRQDGESIVVSVYYSGAPGQNATASDLNEIGLVDIGRTQATLNGSGTVAFDGARLTGTGLG